MQIAMWTGYLWELSPEEMVKAFAERGWTRLELSDEHAHELLRRGDPTKTGEAFRRFAADLGIAIPQGHFLLSVAGVPGEPADLAPSDDTLFDQTMEQMKRWVDLFASIGIEAGVYHCGGDDLANEGWSKERIRDRRREAIGRVVARARGTVTRLCLENLGNSCPTCQEIRSLVEFLPESEIGICLDTGHANAAGVNCAAFVRDAGNRLRALHVHDNLGQHDDHILPYGKGTVDWAPFLAALKEIGYVGLFNWEIPGENRCPMPVRLMKLDYIHMLGEWMIAQGDRPGAPPPYRLASPAASDADQGSSTGR